MHRVPARRTGSLIGDIPQLRRGRHEGVLQPSLAPQNPPSRFVQGKRRNALECQCICPNVRLGRDSVHRGSREGALQESQRGTDVSR